VADESQRTEQPTAKRLGEARSKGNVARSVELNSAAILLYGVFVLRGPGAQLVSDLRALFVETMTQPFRGEITGPWMRTLIINELLRFGPDIGLILLGALVTGVVVTVGQIGFLWARRPFELSQLFNPLAFFRRLFSLAGLVELLKSFLKLGLMGIAAYSFLSGRVNELLVLNQFDMRTALTLWGGLVVDLALQVGVAYLALAILDFYYQRWQYTRGLKMTKMEVKEELKQQEGDPVIKGYIRSQQRRMARQRMLAKVPRADVVITNPTHFAVALQYSREAMNAPQVVAKGAALIAQRIKDIARQNGVPIVENPPLAQVLYRTVELDQEVPPDLYRAVAEVLAFVYRLKTNSAAPVRDRPGELPAPAAG
jgi:flagellar biosynthetic protein FlhB